MMEISNNKIKLSKTRRIIRKIISQKELFLGLVLLTFMFLVAAFGPMICEKDPGFLYDHMLHPPSRQYLFGTDGVGSDVFTLVIYGSRTSLKIGVSVAIISSVIGTLIGAVSGFFGGIVDKILSELLNMFMMVPSFFLMVLVIAVYGSNLNNMILVMALTSWVGTARLMRGQAMSLRERTFIKSAIVMGESKMRILFKHIIPNGIFPVIVNATMSVSGAILSESGLSFLGLGDPNAVSWGRIIATGKRYLPSSWWICVFPGLAIVLTVIAFYLIGDGMNNLLNNK
ncbi:peptide/nickel transport system permease protein [Hathewaya proteolytica DSM 3090]|uniref:Peptide/nickel transport system permease protein n=1 Tax=Hathewaya proteolytica DSM 3090 TaxID=1121331 RepID=A0A1M6PKD7_9CLOT|nr:ABC transporter permease [Hathewaya proteolytica]SHK08456.1 peptide/nickel transport system permease protein [Hathewaya proteolytica DSM 3090]